MSFKNNLKSKQAQSVVEYIVTFIVLITGVLVVFGSLSPDTIGVKSVFERAVINAINAFATP